MKIDWKNPITNGLRFFASFHEGFPYEYVKREHGIPGSAWRGMDPVDGVMAMTINDLDGRTNAVEFPKHDEIYNGISECTIMCFTRNRSSTVSAGQRPYGYMGTGNDPFYMTVGNTGNLAVVLLTTVASYNSTGADYTTEGVDIDRWALWGATWKNDSLTGRWQNRKDSSPTATSGVMAAPDVNADNVPRVGSANVGGTNSWNGWVAFAAFWDRALSDAEWNSMVEHPWQVFAPQLYFAHTQKYFPPAIEAEAPAGNTLTITLVDAAGTTLPNLTGLSWAWFDESTVSTLTAPTAQGTGETTDVSGVLEVDITGTTLGATDTGILTLRDSTGHIYALYRVTLT